MINVFGSCVGTEELEEIKSSLKAQWLGIGPKVNQFEKMMASHVGNDDFVCVNSGSNALLAAIESLQLPKGSEVIIPSVTWISCATSVELAGLKPVFCDVDYDTVNVTTESIYKAKTKRTKAVMVVHYGGFPVLAGYFLNVPVISDCAHAADTFFEGRHIGSFYDVSIFSFDGVKNISSGEMGGVTSPNKKYCDEVRNIRYCGIQKSGFEASTDKSKWWEYELKKPFPKMLPNDITASIGIAQLKKLDILQARRKSIWDRYQESLSDVCWLRLPPEIPEHIKHSYFTYFIKVINGKRDKLARYLLDNGIYTTVRYQPLHLMKYFNSKQKLPVAEKLNEELLNIPLHPSLTDKDVEFIIDKIKAFE